MSWLAVVLNMLTIPSSLQAARRTPRALITRVTTASLHSSSKDDCDDDPELLASKISAALGFSRHEVVMGIGRVRVVILWHRQDRRLAFDG